MAFPVKDDGTLGEGKVFFDATDDGEGEEAGPAGRAEGGRRTGNVFATGPGGVFVFDPDGKHLGTIATGVPTANCGFGDDGTYAVHHADKQPRAAIKTKTKGLGLVSDCPQRHRDTRITVAFSHVGAVLCELCPLTASGQSHAPRPAATCSRPPSPLPSSPVPPGPTGRLPRHDRPDARAAEPGVPRLASSRRPDHAERALLRPQPLRRPEDRPEDVPAQGRRGRRTKPLELTLDDLKLPGREADGDARVRRQRPRVPVPTVPRPSVGLGAVGNAEWTGVPLAALLDQAGVKADGRRSRPRRGRQGADQRRPEVARPDPLRPQPADRQGEEPEVMLAHADERRAAAAGARLPAAGGRRRVVRHGVGQVAHADRRHRQAVPRLLADVRLHLLRPPRRPADARAGDGDAAEGDHRPARVSEVMPAGKPYRLSGAAWAGEAAGRKGRGQHRRRQDLGRRRSCSAKRSRSSGGCGSTSGRRRPAARRR